MTTPTPRPGRSRDTAHFRRVLGHYPTGVSIVTAQGSQGAPLGMVVGSFTSVSMDPPLVAYFAMVTSGSYAQIRQASGFCVNVLAADQEPLCRAFAARGTEKFAGVDWHSAPTGSPILNDAVAWIDCRTEVIHSAGDHDIVVGRVVDLDVTAPRPSLLFFQGGYGSFSAHSLVARNARFASELQLLDGARPLMEVAAKRTGAQVVAIHCDGSELTLLASAGTAADPRITQVAIGQRFQVQPPVGIWWMAFADEATETTYLAELQPEIRHCCRETMAAIRQHGFALGLFSVQNDTIALLQRNLTTPSAPHGRPDALSDLEFDPADYDPAQVTPDTRVGEEPDVVNLWAPSFDASGKPGLGFMLAGFAQGTSLQSHAEALLELTRSVTGIAMH